MVGVSVLRATTIFSVGVRAPGVLIVLLTVGRGVTVGTGVIIMLPGVLVGALSGAAIMITSSVGIAPRIGGVGLRLLCAIAVARSAACAAAASGAIGGMGMSTFQGV